MKTSEQLVERSVSMMIASYWLSRCGVRKGENPASPPAALETATWNSAYDSFFDSMGDGRTLKQFRNSMKNARDTFDVLFDNGRTGWVGREGEHSALSSSFQVIHEQWQMRTDQELEEFVLALQSSSPVATGRRARSPEARTEGGKRVYTSIKLERDPRVREDALALHGFDCMACGFNFERTYGSWGKGFIEVHHVVPLAETGRSKTDPTTDLVVLCANCHRMVHRKRGICLSLDELRAQIN